MSPSRVVLLLSTNQPNMSRVALASGRRPAAVDTLPVSKLPGAARHDFHACNNPCLRARICDPTKDHNALKRYSENNSHNPFHNTTSTELLHTTRSRQSLQLYVKFFTKIGSTAITAFPTGKERAIDTTHDQAEKGSW